MVEQWRHARDLSRGVVNQKAVVAGMPVNVGHDGIHHNHFAEVFFASVCSGEFEHVIDTKVAVKEAMRGDKATFFRGENGTLAGELAMKPHEGVGDVLDICRLQQVRSELL